MKSINKYYILLINFFVCANTFAVNNKIVNLTRIGQPNSQVDIDDTEIFTQDTFKDLIDKKQAEGKPFILARVLSGANRATPFVHFYDAHSINKNIGPVIRIVLQIHTEMLQIM